MEAMARRDFLRGAFIASAKVKTKEVERKPIVRIGKIADFPIGHETHSDSGRLVIQSLPEGLRARSAENGMLYYGIEAGPAGDLLINRAEIWPANRVFSIMTGGPASLETHLEEKE